MVVEESTESEYEDDSDNLMDDIYDIITHEPDINHDDQDNCCQEKDAEITRLKEVSLLIFNLKIQS